MSKFDILEELQEFQEKIVELQEKWKLEIAPFKINFDQAEIDAGAPILELAELELDISQTQRWIMELIDFVIGFKPSLKWRFINIPDLLTNENIMEWLGKSLITDRKYFKHFAEEHGIEEWIPLFLAESTFHPLLQLIAETAQPEVDRMNIIENCPVCFEPIRMATLDGGGKKVIQCPRCYAHWHAKHLQCSHCGNEDHITIHFLTIEGVPAMQIQVCEQCKCYIKILDTKQFITKLSVTLLDLSSIRLDIIAQDKGYFSIREKKVIH
ncbi:formate dehydrogenase accessory protein FdhE [Neobacillus vireti]|uniref:formate dehydrogenase accessory protein FdhE n=1 Tax=Neobacillus vireti TaxID=220686 RepID=UPI002FFDEAD0